MTTALLDPPRDATAPDEGVASELSEFVDGEVIERKPTGLEAGYAAGRVYKVLSNYEDAHGGTAFPDGSGFKAFGIDGTRTRFPDASYVAAGRMESVPRGVGRIAPDLCVEIVSPTDVYTDVREKAEEYLAGGVREVWLIDPAVRVIDVLRPDSSQTFRAGETAVSPDVLQGLEVPVDGLFPAGVAAR